MQRTLAFKLVLSFLFVSLVITLLAAFLARWISVQEFQNLVLDQAESRFVAEMTVYYQARGSWQGVMDYLRLRNQPLAPDPNANKPPLQPDLQEQRQAAQPLVFVLADQNGRVVVPAASYRIGDRLTQAEMGDSAPVEVQGQVVGYALATGSVPALDPREERYLARTNEALLLAALGAMVIALVLGILLARTLTRPLGELTSAIRRMAAGELEQQVAVRSQDEVGELARAFNQLSAELAQLTRQRRQVTADIAHDLRTPLTVIGGYIEAMRDGTLKPSPERLDTIYTEVRHLQRLVEDLRTLSLAESGQIALTRLQMAPSALLERIQAAYQQRAGQFGVELGLQVEPGLPEISMDPERMAQVLGNLVSNALRHTPPGGRVTLSASRRGQAVALEVSDTGQGIPAEALPHIFDRFYRVDEARQQAEGESGLGLAIARSLVEAHGGTITAHSTLGQGATFTILFNG